MKVKVKKLLSLLEKRGITSADLARKMGVAIPEVEKLLSGEAVGKNTAREFIEYFGADTAQGLVDWDAIGKKNPLACEADDESSEGAGE